MLSFIPQAGAVIQTWSVVKKNTMNWLQMTFLFESDKKRCYDHTLENFFEVMIVSNIVEDQ